MAKSAPPWRKVERRALRYQRAVLNGDRATGRLERLAVERHVRDMKTGKARGLQFDKAAGSRPVEFIELFCRHSKGEWAGSPLILSDWQVWTLFVLFGWKKVDGTRRFSEALEMVGRKNGKTTKLAGVGLYLTIADGEPGAEVYSAATKKDQAKICFDEATRMVKASPQLSKRLKPYRDNLHMPGTATKFEPLGADADTMDGLNPYAALIDELHAHKTRAVYDVLDSAGGSRRQPLLYQITTAGQAGDTICFEQYQYAIKVLEQVFEDDSFFAFIAAADQEREDENGERIPADQWDDPRTWEKANPNFGVSVKPEYLARRARKVANQPAALTEFERKHLNWFTNATSRWLSLSRWDLCPTEANENDLQGRECFVGLDLANTQDVAAAAYVFPPKHALPVEELDEGDEDEAQEIEIDPAEQTWRVLMRYWMPEQRVLDKVKKRIPYDQWAREGLVTLTDGDVIDYDRIREDLNDDADRYQFRQIGADPWNATQLTTQLTADSHEVVPVRQGYFSMSAASKYLERLVMARLLDHGGDKVLRWMASNAVKMEDPAGNIKPAKNKSAEKIDGIVAVIIALSRAIVNVEPGSIYEKRGLRVIG